MRLSDFTSLKINEQKETLSSLLASPQSLETLSSVATLYREALPLISSLDIEVLEVLSLARAEKVPSAATRSIEEFREELYSYLQGIFSSQPRELHSILYRFGFPTDVGCG